MAVTRRTTHVEAYGLCGESQDVQIFFSRWVLSTNPSPEENSRVLDSARLPLRMSRMNADPLRQLFPALTDAELNAARENLDLYLELAWEILEENCGLSTVDETSVPS